MNTEVKSQLEINIPSSESSVTRNQKDEHTLGTELTRTTTLESAREKMQTLLDNPIFSGFLLIMAGIAIAFQAGKKYHTFYYTLNQVNLYVTGCNATLNRYGGRSFSSVISFSLGVVCCLIFFAVDVTIGKIPLPNDHVKS